MPYSILLAFGLGCGSSDNDAQNTESTTEATAVVSKPIHFTPFYVQQIIFSESVSLPKAKIKGKSTSDITNVNINTAFATLGGFSKNRTWSLNKEKSRNANSSPYLYPIGVIDVEGGYIYEGLEAEYTFPNAFKKTGKKAKGKQGIFQQHEDMILVAMSFAKNETATRGKNDLLIALKGNSPSRSFAQYTSTFPPHPLFRDPSQSTDVSFESLPDNGKIAVLCWGGYEKGQWPTPQEYTDSSLTWKGKNPRQDLQNNVCELWLLAGQKASDSRVKGNNEDFFANLKYSHLSNNNDGYFLLSVLSSKKGMSSAAVANNFPDTLRTEAATEFKVEERDLINLMLEEPKQEFTATEKSPEPTKKVPKKSTKNKKNAKPDEENPTDNTQEDSANEQQPPQRPPQRLFTACEENYQKNLDKGALEITEITIERSRAWIKEVGLPLEFIEKDNSLGVFSITKVKNHIEDCIALQIFFNAFYSTANCRPTLIDSEACKDSLTTIIYSSDLEKRLKAKN